MRVARATTAPARVGLVRVRKRTPDSWPLLLSASHPSPICYVLPESPSAWPGREQGTKRNFGTGSGLHCALCLPAQQNGASQFISAGRAAAVSPAGENCRRDGISTRTKGFSGSNLGAVFHFPAGRGRELLSLLLFSRSAAHLNIFSIWRKIARMSSPHAVSDLATHADQPKRPSASPQTVGRAVFASIRLVVVVVYLSATARDKSSCLFVCASRRLAGRPADKQTDRVGDVKRGPGSRNYHCLLQCSRVVSGNASPGAK